MSFRHSCLISEGETLARLCIVPSHVYALDRRCTQGVYERVFEHIYRMEDRRMSDLVECASRCTHKCPMERPRTNCFGDNFNCLANTAPA